MAGSASLIICPNNQTQNFSASLLLCLSALKQMSIGRLIRTIRYLKSRQVWFQVWRRVQRALEAHPKCGADELPEFTFLNLAVRPKGWNDTSLDMLWRYNLHYFDYLVNAEKQRSGGAESLFNAERQGREEAEGLILKWIEVNPKGSIPGWDPYPTSLRIVNWIKYLNSDSAHSASLRLCVENSLIKQLEWLEGHVEWQIMANHLLANLKALIIGNKYLDRDYAKWMRLYREQIAEQILPDGGHFERSVMYHAIILEDVFDVMKFCGDEAEWLKPVAAKMLRYLVDMTGPDGKIAMFNDAADGIAKSTEWLCGYARSLEIEVPSPEPFADFPDTGYTRMTVGDFVLFVDAGAIGPDYQTGHAHADTLTYELYWKGRKVVTDTGTSEYRGKRRAYERSTAAHNVVEVEGRNSSEVWSSHRVGARARIVERVVGPGRIFAAHDGYGDKIGRELTLTEDGLTVVEKVEGRGKCVTRVHLTEEELCRVERVGGVFNAEAQRRSGEEFEYAVEFGKLKKGRCIVWKFDAPEEFAYTIKRPHSTV